MRRMNVQTEARLVKAIDEMAEAMMQAWDDQAGYEPEPSTKEKYVKGIQHTLVNLATTQCAIVLTANLPTQEQKKRLPPKPHENALVDNVAVLGFDVSSMVLAMARNMPIIAAKVLQAYGVANPEEDPGLVLAVAQAIGMGGNKEDQLKEVTPAEIGDALLHLLTMTKGDGTVH